MALSFRRYLQAFAALGALALTPLAEAQVAGPYVDTSTGTYDSACPAGGPTLVTPGDLRVTINVPDSFTIDDVDVSIRVDHLYRLDTEAWITSPSGTRVQLLSGPAPNFQVADYNVRFDQDAATEVNTGVDAGRDHNSAAASPQYTLRPEAGGSLDDFDGQSATGNWHIDFCDNFAAADDGTVDRVELFFTEAASPTDADLSLTVTPGTTSPYTGGDTFIDVAVTNNGPAAANLVSAAVNLPSGLTFQSSDAGGAYNSGLGIWTIGSIPAGQSRTMRMIARVEASGSYIVTSEVASVVEGDPDSTPGNGVGAGEDDDDSATLFPQAAPAQIYCLGRPIEPLVFENPILESGTDLQIGAVYRFVNASPGVDALVEVTAFNGGGSLLAIDNAVDGINDNFQPSLLGGTGDASVDFEITMVSTGTNTPGLLDFAGSVIDVDGNSGGLREYVEVSNNIVEFALNNPTRLITQANTPPDAGASAPSAFDRIRFEAATSDTAPGIDPNEPRNIATSFFTDVAVFEYRIGKFGDATGGTGRLNSLAFNCPTLTTPNQNPSADEDFGDAPLSYGNPIHTLIAGVRMGATNTAETGPGDSPTAASDAGDDGATLPAIFVASVASNVTVDVTGAGGYLQAFADWNGDGDFADSGEQIAANVQDNDSDGAITISVTPPASAAAGSSFLRLRWSTASGVGVEDPAGDGEVEDYQIQIAAAPSYTCPAGFTYAAQTAHAASVIVAAQNAPNALGAPEGPGIGATTGNSSRVRSADPELAVQLTHLVPAGAPIDITIAPDNNGSNINIETSTDGSNWIPAANYTRALGTLDQLADFQILAPAGGASFVRFTRNSGGTWIDALTYTDTCESSGSPRLAAEKTQNVYDPASAGLYMLPGNDVIYTISVTNTGDGTADFDSIELIDRLPSEIEFWNGDMDDGGALTSNPVAFQQSGSTLTFDYATDVRFGTGSTPPADFDACTNVAPDAAYRPDLTFICFRPTGAMTFGDPDPAFSVSFRARIK